MAAEHRNSIISEYESCRQLQRRVGLHLSSNWSCIVEICSIFSHKFALSKKEQENDALWPINFIGLSLILCQSKARSFLLSPLINLVLF